MSKKTEIIYALNNNHVLLRDNKTRDIGYKVGFSSKQQIKRMTGSGCIAPGIICFYFNRPKKLVDTFYFENGIIAYITVQMSTEQYLCDVYNECILKSYNENEFIKKVVSTYTYNEMGH